MSERKFIIPEYGPFAGMRVVCSGSLVAMPFAATMLADFGAEVIQIERPGVGDTLRMLAPFAEVNGKKEVLSVTIKPEAVDPEDVEMLQDLVVSAVNEALRQAEEAMDGKMNALTSGLGLGGFGF